VHGCVRGSTEADEAGGEDDQDGAEQRRESRRRANMIFGYPATPPILGCACARQIAYAARAFRVTRAASTTYFKPRRVTTTW
jgi:hypothetical protein